MSKTVKGLCSTLAAVMMFGALAPSANAAACTFEDVHDREWYRDYVYYAAEKGLFTGDTQTRFGPERSITRGEFITVLGRLHERLTGTQLQAKDESVFTDVPEDAYFAEAVHWGWENGIIQGYTEYIFGPEESISREDTATMLVRYLEYAGIAFTEPVDWFCTKVEFENGKTLEEYRDGDRISSWAVEPVELLSRYRILLGKEIMKEGIWVGNDLICPIEFQPQCSITRAEVAAILSRVYQGVVYSENTETVHEKIQRGYSTAAKAEQELVLQGAKSLIISDAESYQALLERLGEASETVSAGLEEGYFEEGSILAVEYLYEGKESSAANARLTECTVQEHKVTVTFLKEAHGSERGAGVMLYLIEVPKNVTEAEIQSEQFVHRVEDVRDWEPFV